MPYLVCCIVYAYSFGNHVCYHYIISLLIFINAFGLDFHSKLNCSSIKNILTLLPLCVQKLCNLSAGYKDILTALMLRENNLLPALILHSPPAITSFLCFFYSKTSKKNYLYGLSLHPHFPFLLALTSSRLSFSPHHPNHICQSY